MATAFQSDAFQSTPLAFQILSGGIVWPDPSVVLLGITYGPNGNDYVGTLETFNAPYKYDITTGMLVKLISNKFVMTL